MSAPGGSITRNLPPKLADIAEVLLVLVLGHLSLPCDWRAVVAVVLSGMVETGWHEPAIGRTCAA